MPGRSEEIFTDITKGQKYDVEDAESSVFKQNVVPNGTVRFLTNDPG